MTVLFLSDFILPKSQLVPACVLIFASILWGLTWLPLHFLKDMGLDGIPLILISQAILAVLFSVTGWRIPIDKRNLLLILGIALCGGGAILCFTYALTYGEVIRVMVLFYLLPVWGVLGGKVFLEEEIDLWRWLGVVMAVFGAFIILGGWSVLQSPPSWIDAMALASGMLFAGNNMFFRGATEISLSSKLMAMCLGCSLLCALVLLSPSISWPQHTSNEAWWWLIAYTLVWMFIANIASQWAVTHMESGKSSIILIMELLAAVVSAMWIAGERFTTIEWLGCLLIVAAAIVESCRIPDDLPVEEKRTVIK